MRSKHPTHIDNMLKAAIKEVQKAAANIENLIINNLNTESQKQVREILEEIRPKGVK